MCGVGAMKLREMGIRGRRMKEEGGGAKVRGSQREEES
jgi:hypothetical protein